MNASTAGSRISSCLFLAYGALILIHTSPPSLTDYANWTYQATLLQHHWAGLADSAHSLKSYPVPNSAATVGVAALSAILPWKVAAKVWLCLYLFFAWFTTRQMLKTTGGSKLRWLIVPGATYLGVNFWYGFINFQLGLCWVVLLASMLVMRAKGENTRWSRDWILGLLLLLTFWTHMIPFAFACLMLFLYAMQTGCMSVLWQYVPSAVLSVWYLAGRYLVSHDVESTLGLVSSVRTFSAAFWAYKANSYLKSFGFVNSGTSSGSVDITVLGKPFFVLLFLLNLVLCCGLAWSMYKSMQAAFRQRTPQRFVWMSILLVIPVFLLAPGNALGVSDPGSRVLQVALAPGLALCLEGRRALQTAAVASSALSLTALFLFSQLVFSPVPQGSTGAPLPRAVATFGHVENHNQDSFYSALEAGDMRLPVFPTGIFVNWTIARPLPSQHGDVLADPSVHADPKDQALRSSAIGCCR